MNARFVPYLLIAPSLAFLAVLFFVPLVQTIALAFQADGASSAANFVRMAGDLNFTDAVVNNFEISIPEEPSVAGITLSSNCSPPNSNDPVAGAWMVASVGGKNWIVPVASADPGGLTGVGTASVLVIAVIRLSFGSAGHIEQAWWGCGGHTGGGARGDEITGWDEGPKPRAAPSWPDPGDADGVYPAVTSM